MNKIDLTQLTDHTVTDSNDHRTSITSKFQDNKVLTNFTKQAFPSDYKDLLQQLTSNNIVAKKPSVTDSDDATTSTKIDIAQLLDKPNQAHLNLIGQKSTVILKDDQLNQSKITMVYPATDKIIRKYTKKTYQLVKETGQVYKNVVEPYVLKNQHSNEWIYNVLEGKAEADRTVFVDHDPVKGFLLALSMNWPGEVENMYLNTLTMDRDILSVRSLRASHLPMLRYMKQESLRVCREKFNLSEEDLRIYVHYQPSFYHFHLHIVNASYYPPSMTVERAILLSDIMRNLEMDGDYYEKKTMQYLLDSDSELLKLIREFEDGIKTL